MKKPVRTPKMKIVNNNEENKSIEVKVTFFARHKRDSLIYSFQKQAGL